jgi:hypothetical protein
VSRTVRAYTTYTIDSTSAIVRKTTPGDSRNPPDADCPPRGETTAWRPVLGSLRLVIGAKRSSAPDQAPPATSPSVRW